MISIRRRRRAFTLVELLIVVGIVSLLVGLTVPAIGRTRQVAYAVRCASNMHQILVAMNEYVAESRGYYPPNTATPAPGLYWYDDDRAGSFLPATRPPVPAGKPGGGPYVCPCDDIGLSFLSYSMNAWASSALDPSVMAQVPASALRWSPHVGNASKMILLVESYSGAGTAAGYYAPPTVGVAVAATPTTSAGQRFGGAGGVVISARRFGAVVSELCYMRHRVPGTPGVYTQPIGRLNVGYADGHVAARNDSDLVTRSGVATGDSYWSPADWRGH